METLLAYITDLAFGDPKNFPHPVVYIGKLIEALERFLRAGVAKLIGLKAAGVILTLVTVGAAYGLTWGLLAILMRFSLIAAIIVAIWLVSTTLATKSLGDAGLEIYCLLKAGNLEESRRKVGWIVGRDTQNLTPQEVTRATIETVAENVVDAIVSPMFYAFLGGAPLAMAYRAVNTLDSMVGYKNEKYLNFGWASARLDDIANFIPARITALLIPLAALLLDFSAKGAVAAMHRDAPKHPSPNSGYPEAGVAGALGIRLGGLNYYGGKESFRAYMGDATRDFDPEDIAKTVRIMYLVSALACGLGVIILYLTGKLFSLF